MELYKKILSGYQLGKYAWSDAVFYTLLAVTEDNVDEICQNLPGDKKSKIIELYPECRWTSEGPYPTKEQITLIQSRLSDFKNHD